MYFKKKIILKLILKKFIFILDLKFFHFYYLSFNFNFYTFKIFNFLYK